MRRWLKGIGTKYFYSKRHIIRELDQLRETNSEAIIHLENARQEFEKLRQILTYQDTLVAGSKDKGSLQIIKLPRTGLRFAWLRVEFIEASHFKIEVFHPTGFPDRLSNNKIAHALVEFTGNSSTIMEISVNSSFRRIGIATRIIRQIERESLIRGNLFIRGRFAKGEIGKGFVLLLGKNGFEVNMSTDDRIECTKILGR